MTKSRLYIAYSDRSTCTCTGLHLEYLYMGEGGGRREEGWGREGEEGQLCVIHICSCVQILSLHVSLYPIPLCFLCTCTIVYGVWKAFHIPYMKVQVHKHVCTFATTNKYVHLYMEEGARREGGKK